VGDPLQIPPVVSLPERLITEVCAYFNVTQTEWAAPAASAQTLADAASHLQAEFRADAGTRRVGLPLLVHRRCQAPMFDICNAIAYDHQMVQAVQTSDGGLVGRVLGESTWFDVDGVATSKWCPAEGEAAVQLMARLAAAGVREPDIYLITPFRVVSQELRTRLADEPELLQRLGIIDGNSWLRERVGTIHTFQGKEAEAVVAILGAPIAAQQGARRWACATPNILNVMVSRARRRLYVVGSRAAWGSVGKCQVLAAALPVRKV
jgi:superfamily I DNA and/or RNA helicase